MNVGIPTEIKSDEQRVSLTPAGVAALRTHGHRVMVQAGAGVGSGFADRDYRNAGASIVADAAGVWLRADMILKVKEPQPPEYPLMRPGLIVFTYLHLAADPRLARELIRRRVTAVGYETIQLDDLSLPLLAPMSEVAGRLAIQAGSWCLQARSGGRAAGQSSRARRRNLGPQRMPRCGGSRRRSDDHGYQSDAPALPRGPARRPRTPRDVESRDARGGSHHLRPGDRRRAGPGRARAAAAQRQDGGADAARRGDRGSVDRSRWYRGNVGADDARAPNLHSQRRRPLLRNQHARDGPAHLDLRADQRNANLRAGNRGPRHSGSRPAKRGNSPRPQHLRRPRRAPGSSASAEDEITLPVEVARPDES